MPPFGPFVLGNYSAYCRTACANQRGDEFVVVVLRDDEGCRPSRIRIANSSNPEDKERSRSVKHRHESHSGLDGEIYKSLIGAVNLVVASNSPAPNTKQSMSYY
jgi:hypothetical protein